MKLPSQPSPSTPTPWKWPLDLDAYDRSPTLTRQERAALAMAVRHKAKWSLRLHDRMARLTLPLRDSLKITKALKATRDAVIRAAVIEMDARQSSYWAWQPSDWISLLSLPTDEFYSRYRAPADTRAHLMIASYLLCGFVDFRGARWMFKRYPFACKVFGKAILDEAIEVIYRELAKMGYGQFQARQLVRNVVCEAFLLNRSPILNELTAEVLERVRVGTTPHYVKKWVCPI